MAFSKCPHCKSGSFEIATKEPSGSAYTQCSGCGAPFGVSDYYNLGTLLQKQEKAIDEVASRLDRVAVTLAHDDDATPLARLIYCKTTVATVFLIICRANVPTNEVVPVV